ELDLSAMDEAVLDTGRLADGTLVGAPLGIGIFSVGVNTALLEQAGIELPDDTSWTWEELSELSQQVGEWADEAGEDVVGLDFFGTSAAAFHCQFHTQTQTFQAASGEPMQLLRLPALTSGDHQMVNKASMYWSISAETPQAEASATLVDFLLRDPEAAKVLKIERGVTAFPELQDDIGTVLTDEEMISLDFARDLQSEVVRPPLVTPASGVGFGDELSRLSEESLFGNRTPEDAAAEILSVLESMQPDA